VYFTEGVLRLLTLDPAIGVNKIDKVLSSRKGDRARTLKFKNKSELDKLTLEDWMVSSLIDQLKTFKLCEPNLSVPKVEKPPKAVKPTRKRKATSDPVLPDPVVDTENVDMLSSDDDTDINVDNLAIDADRYTVTVLKTHPRVKCLKKRESVEAATFLKEVILNSLRYLGCKSKNRKDYENDIFTATITVASDSDGVTIDLNPFRDEG
jgi:hypothetical protein